MEKQKIIILGLVAALTIVSMSHIVLNEEYDTLELHYGYAMDMAKMNLDNPGMTEEVKDRVLESVKDNTLI